MLLTPFVHPKRRITKGVTQRPPAASALRPSCPLLGGGGAGQGVVPFSALVSLLGERQDKDGKGDRIRAEALVV